MENQRVQELAKGKSNNETVGQGLFALKSKFAQRSSKLPKLVSARDVDNREQEAMAQQQNNTAAEQQLLLQYHETNSGETKTIIDSARRFLVQNSQSQEVVQNFIIEQNKKIIELEPSRATQGQDGNGSHVVDLAQQQPYLITEESQTIQSVIDDLKEINQSGPGPSKMMFRTMNLEPDQLQNNEYGGEIQNSATDEIYMPQTSLEKQSQQRNQFAAVQSSYLTTPQSTIITPSQFKTHVQSMIKDTFSGQYDSYNNHTIQNANLIPQKQISKKPSVAKIMGAPLRSLTPILPSQRTQSNSQREKMSSYREEPALQRNKEEDAATAFVSQPVSLVGTARDIQVEILNSNEQSNYCQSLSQSVLEFEYQQLAQNNNHNYTNEPHKNIELQLQREETMENSQLYETGEQSEALRSILSRTGTAIQSNSSPEIVSHERVQATATEQNFAIEDHKIQQEQILTCEQSSQQSNEAAPATLTQEDQIAVITLNRSNPAVDVSLVGDSIERQVRSQQMIFVQEPRQQTTPSIISASQAYPYTQPTFQSQHQNQEVLMTNSTSLAQVPNHVAIENLPSTEDLKNSIALRYDKMDLQQKLDDMVQNIDNFKTVYGVAETAESILLQKSPSINKGSQDFSSVGIETYDIRSRYQNTLKPNRSNSKLIQNKPRAGKPRALKVVKKKKQLQIRDDEETSSIMDTEAEHEQDSQHFQGTVDEDCYSEDQKTTINSDVQQTFRPGSEKAPDKNNNCPTNPRASRGSIRQQRENMIKKVVQQYHDYNNGEECGKQQKNSSRRQPRFKRNNQSKQSSYQSQPPPSRSTIKPLNFLQHQQQQQQQQKYNHQIQESDHFDARYFTAMPMTEDSMAQPLVSGRTDKDSIVQNNLLNLIKCLQTGSAKELTKNNENDFKLIYSKSGSAVGLSDTESHVEEQRQKKYQQTQFQQKFLRNSRSCRAFGSFNAQQNSSHSLAAQVPEIINQSSNFKDFDGDNVGNFINNNNSCFGRIISPRSSKSFLQDLCLLSPRSFAKLSELGQNAAKLNAQPVSKQHQSSLSNIEGFELVREIHQQMLLNQQKREDIMATQTRGISTALASSSQPDNRSRMISKQHQQQQQQQQQQLYHESEAKNIKDYHQKQQQPLHQQQILMSEQTQRSMGIESYCQKKNEQEESPDRQDKINQVYLKTYNSTQKETQQSPSKAIDTSTLAQIQQKSEMLSTQLGLTRNSFHQEIQDTKNELNQLREDNKSLKHKIEISEIALESSQTLNAKQGATIEQLTAEIKCLKEEKAEAKDTDLLIKYKETVKEKQELTQLVAQKEISLDSNQKSQEKLQKSYETMKQGQSELLELNKNLSERHQVEISRLQDDIKALELKLDTKNKKLQQCMEIIKEFDGQISSFEEFQKTSNNELQRLQTQNDLYQDLFIKERREKEEILIRGPNQNQRNLMMFDSVQSPPNWAQSRISEFESQKNSFAITTEAPKSQAEPIKLAQTLSKQASFGQGLLTFGSNQSIKNREYLTNNQGGIPRSSSNSDQVWFRRDHSNPRSSSNNTATTPKQQQLNNVLSDISSENGNSYTSGSHVAAQRQSNHNGEATYEYQQRNGKNAAAAAASSANTTTSNQQDFPPHQRVQQQQLQLQLQLQQQQDIEVDIVEVTQQDASFLLQQPKQRSSSRNNYKTDAIESSANNDNNNTTQTTTTTNQFYPAYEVPEPKITTHRRDQRDEQSRVIAEPTVAPASTPAEAVDHHDIRDRYKQLGLLQQQDEQPADEDYEAFLKQKLLVGSSSAFIGSKKNSLQLKKPNRSKSRENNSNTANTTNTQQKTGNASNAVDNHHNHNSSNSNNHQLSIDDKQKLLNTLNSSDYYYKLQDMQKRLEQAKDDIKQNVAASSRSRSRSPPMGAAVVSNSTFEDYPVSTQIVMKQQQKQQQLTTQHHQQQHQTLDSSLITRKSSNLNLTNQSNQSSFTQRQKSCNPYHSVVESQQPSSQQPNSQKRRGSALGGAVNSGRSWDRRKDGLAKQVQGRRQSKSRLENVNHSSNLGMAANNTGIVRNQTPLYFTSLYNGVQPLSKF